MWIGQFHCVHLSQVLVDRVVGTTSLCDSWSWSSWGAEPVACLRIQLSGYCDMNMNI